MAASAFNLRGLRALAILAVTAVGAVTVFLPLLARDIDSAERLREVRRAEAGLHQIGNDALQRLRSVANWDTALLNLDNRFDPVWAQDMLVSGVGIDVTSRVVAVFDTNDRLVFARKHARPMPLVEQNALQKAAAGLIAAMRSREAARGLDRHATAVSPTSPPAPAAPPWIDADATMLVQGRPTLIQASLVGPDKGIARQHRPRAPILLYASDLRDDVLADLRDHLLLRDPRITTGPSHTLPAFLPLRGPGGQVAATLQWRPERPGTELLVSAAPPLLALLIALITAVVVAYRQGLAGTRALMASEARAQHLALHDSLTGLPNRSLLDDRLAQMLARASRHGGDVTLLLVDLDRFKVINDTYGHPTGDQLLRQVGQCLSDICRASDTCARLGGDEFVIVAAESGAKAAAALAERILGALSATIDLPSHRAPAVLRVQTGASIGLSVSTDGAGTPLDMMRQADLALYKAKNEGRGRYRFFEPEMDLALQDRRLLESDLRQALAAGALAVHYQPQYDGDHLCAVEALVRWVHPERGAIAPAVFVKLAEECGLIEQLGELVLRRAFADSRNWPGLRIAINISTTQLATGGFVEQLLALAAEAGVQPRNFELEITESVLMDDTPHIHATLADIRAAGFSLALDDFGTGFSSLSYLHRFPIGKLKIDRSFVMRLPEDRAACAVVHAIVRLARALDLDTTAEGVETAAQRTTLASFGCRLTQGYLTGRPMPAAAIDALLGKQLATAA